MLRRKRHVQSAEKVSSTVRRKVLSSEVSRFLLPPPPSLPPSPSRGAVPPSANPVYLHSVEYRGARYIRLFICNTQRVSHWPCIHAYIDKYLSRSLARARTSHTRVHDDDEELRVFWRVQFFRRTLFSPPRCVLLCSNTLSLPPPSSLRSPTPLPSSVPESQPVSHPPLAFWRTD